MKTNKQAAKRKLRAARAGKGYTQADVAKVFRVDPATISTWESDIYNMRYGQLLQLCSLLGVTLAEIEKGA